MSPPAEGVTVLQRAERRFGGFTFGAYLRNIDWVLLFVALALSGIGLAMIYSATYQDSNIDTPTAYVDSQLIGLILGLGGMVVLSLLDFSWLTGWRRYLYVGIVALLALTLVAGDERMGARRWLTLPFFDLQTSELAKVVIITSFGAFLSEGVELRNRLRFVILALGYVAFPAVLIFLQPDLGTSLVFAVVFFTMLLVWGARWTHLAGLVLAGLAGIVVVLRVLPATFGIHLLKPYQLERLAVFLNPESDISDAGYQLTQSKIAVASGMVTGKGFMEGTQTHLNFLPAHHTDFIFSVIGEELGFVGAGLLLGLYLVFLWRAFRIAGMAKNLYGTLLASGIIGVVLFQVFVNVGMTVGIMPITGVPLPFVSFGSSSLVVFFLAVGLLQSIHVHSRTALYGGRVKGD
ncbi:MAG: rod shape-determining protein RodA [Thermoleophilia bacterium]